MQFTRQQPIDKREFPHELGTTAQNRSLKKMFRSQTLKNDKQTLHRSDPANKPPGPGQHRGRPRRAEPGGGGDVSGAARGGGVSKRASRCLAVEPWSRGAVSRPAEETLARGGVSGFPQVRFDSWEEAGGSSSWRHSCLRPPPPTPGGTPAPGPARHSTARQRRGARGLLGEAGAAWGPRGLMKHLMCITAGQGETRTPPPQRARHFSSPAGDFPMFPPPPPATGQKGAGRAGCGVAPGGLARVMLSSRWWKGGGGRGRCQGWQPPALLPRPGPHSGTTTPTPPGDGFGPNPPGARRVQNPEGGRGSGGFPRKSVP